MRPIITLALALALPAAAHAQHNQATVTQAGGATASIVQSGSGPSGGSNRAVVAQSGASTTSVHQTGTLNLADVAQAGAGNTSEVAQAGSDNDGLVYQGKSGTLLPVGDGTASGNDAVLKQSGSSNRGLRQNMLDPLDAGIIYQGVRGGTAMSNIAAVSQVGDHGHVWVSQGDTGGTAVGNATTVDQHGFQNDANTVQGYYSVSGVVQAAGGTASITQAAGSENNDATIYQGVNGESAGDRATITQTGRFDLAIVSQGSYLDVGTPASYVGRSSGNTATVSQGGTGMADYANRATVLQGVNGGEAVGNDASVVQFAGTLGNAAFVNQGVEAFASGSHAFVTQTSDDNLSVVTQSGMGHTATTVQN